MREILFRGKRKSGAWVYGSLIQEPGFVGIIERDEERYDYPYMDSTTGCIDGNACIVDPDTVGQYTGLTDKNGKKIFEGDIVHMNSKKFCLSGHGVVVYRNGSFAIDDRKRNRLYPFMQNGQYNAGDYRVDGNVHDNSELLEVRRND